LRGLLATGLHQLPAAIDEMPLPDAWEQIEYWNQWPPEHVLLRGFTGYKPPSETEDVSDLAALLGPAQQPPAYIRELVAWTEETSRSLGIKHGQS
jgi:hypothetical protein